MTRVLPMVVVTQVLPMAVVTLLTERLNLTDCLIDLYIYVMFYCYRSQ